MTLLMLIIALLILLHIADIYTTYESLKKENVTEKNPIMRFFMKKLGILPALIFIKMISTAVYIQLILLIPILYSIIATSGVCLLYGYIVYNNWKIMEA